MRAARTLNWTISGARRRARFRRPKTLKPRRRSIVEAPVNLALGLEYDHAAVPHIELTERSNIPRRIKAATGRQRLPSGTPAISMPTTTDGFQIRSFELHRRTSALSIAVATSSEQNSFDRS